MLMSPPQLQITILQWLIGPSQRLLRSRGWGPGTRWAHRPAVHPSSPCPLSSAGLRPHLPAPPPASSPLRAVSTPSRRSGSVRTAAGAAKASSPAPPPPVGGGSAHGVPTPRSPCRGPGPLDWMQVPHPMVGGSAQVRQGGLEAGPVPALKGVRQELGKTSQNRSTRSRVGVPWARGQRPQSRSGPSAGRPTVLPWPSGGQGPVCTPGPAPTIKAPKRLRSSICEQDLEAPALSRASLGTSSSGPALGCPCQAGQSLPALHLLLCDPWHPPRAWELIPRAGAETVATVPRVVSAD